MGIDPSQGPAHAPKDETRDWGAMTKSGKPDAVDLLLQQHERIRDMSAAVDKAAGTKVKQERFEELRRLLAVHETAEELVTHPRARIMPSSEARSSARVTPSRLFCGAREAPVGINTPAGAT